MQVIADAGRYTEPLDAPTHWVEQLRSKHLSVGTYSLPAGGVDDQQPHTEDEIYVVCSGRATLVCDSGTAQLGPGAVVFVPARERHQWTDIEEELSLLVLFAPPYGTSSAPPTADPAS